MRAAREGVFDADDLAILRHAYTNARKALSSCTVGLDGPGQGELSDLLAKAVIAAARGGERDVGRLSDVALDRIGSYCRIWGHSSPARRAGAPSVSLRAFVIDLAEFRRAKGRRSMIFGC